MKKNSETDRKYVQILGINVIISSSSRVLTRVRDLISHNNKFYIVTPGPEHVLASNSDSELKNALDNADLSVPDGVGLKYASKFLYGQNLPIIPGRKLFVDLIELANKKKWRVFFLGGKGDEAEVAATKLYLNYKKVKIRTLKGPILDSHANPVSEVDRVLYFDAIQQINEFEPHLLFVAMGNPKQEKWIYKNIKSLNIGGAMTVGGTLRYIAGHSKLPPSFLESLGLEWFYRLLTEPFRIKRIFQAVVVFPLKVFWYKLANSWRAR